MGCLINKSIAIIGGGPAGITAALRLQQRGHKPTVFESKPNVGGKCLAIERDGRLFEMGALLIGDKYHEIRGMVEACGHSLTTSAGLKGPEFVFIGKLAYKGLSLTDKIRYVIEYYRFQVRYHFLADKSTVKRSPLTAVQFYRLNELPILKQVIASVLSGLGYGYLDEISVNYFDYFYEISKAYLSPFSKELAFKSSLGMSELWQDIAKDLEVRTSSEVYKVAISTTGSIRINDSVEEFDALIFACPPFASKTILGPLADGYSFLDQFNYVKYHTFLVQASPFPTQYGYFPSWVQGSFKRSSLPVAWYQPYANNSHVLIYSIAEPDANLEYVKSQIHKGLADIGVSIQSIEQSCTWDYFPHFSTEHIANDVLSRVESLQGKNGIYWAGEYLSFATIEHSARNASELVNNYF